jgi:probable HAF family extracellular repeat protein
MRQIGPVGGGTTYGAYGYALNNRGFVVGTTYSTGLPEVTPGQPNFHAFIWYGHQLNDLNVGDYSAANGINDRNEVVGVSGLDEQTPAFGFLWREGKFERLPSFGGSSAAYAINNRGHIVGTFQVGDTIHSFLYADGQSKDIGTIPSLVIGGAPRIIAGALNIFDDIVGSFLPDSNSGYGFAFFWSRGNMVDLNSFLPTNSGWVLYGASGINDFGQIVGGGTHNGLNRAFLLTPIR